MFYASYRVGEDNNRAIALEKDASYRKNNCWYPEKAPAPRVLPTPPTEPVGAKRPNYAAVMPSKVFMQPLKTSVVTKLSTIGETPVVAVTVPAATTPALVVPQGYAASTVSSRARQQTPPVRKPPVRVAVGTKA